MLTQKTSRFVMCSPEYAEQLLARNLYNPRRLNRRLVDFYADQQERGEWQPGIASVNIDINGNMFNGQHVCRSIIQSGVTVLILLIEGCPVSDAIWQDSGMSRTPSQTLQLESYISSGIRIAIQGFEGHPGRIAVGRLLDFKERFPESISFISRVLPKGVKKISIGPVVAGFIRGYYSPKGLTPVKLQRCAEVLVTGESVGMEESGIRVLRNFLLLNGTAGSCWNREAYSKVERMLWAYKAGQPLTKLYGAQQELFPFAFFPDPVVTSGKRASVLA